MLVWGPKRRKSKKTLRGRPEIAAGPALAARVLYGRQSGREISETSLGKGKRDFFDLRGLGFGTAKIVSKRENDGSEKKSRPAELRKRTRATIFRLDWPGLVRPRVGAIRSSNLPPANFLTTTGGGFSQKTRRHVALGTVRILI